MSKTEIILNILMVGVVAGFILILTYRNEKKSRKKNIRVQ